MIWIVLKFHTDITLIIWKSLLWCEVNQFHIHVIGIYSSKSKVTISHLIDALTQLHDSVLIESTIPTVLLGDFNIDQCRQIQNKRLYKNILQQTMDTLSWETTDYCTQIDHVYTKVLQCVQSAGALVSYYCDHTCLFIFPWKLFEYFPVCIISDHY